jgi:hypothetical protein
MDKMRVQGLLLAVFLLGILTWPATAVAESMTWRVKSLHPYEVWIEFYSQRRRISWPGNGRAYPLSDSNFHDFTLSCFRGENICYGAWDGDGSGTTWGVGRNQSEGCVDCCYLCEGGTTEIVLQPPATQRRRNR